jgi:hypothetical protein
MAGLLWWEPGRFVSSSLVFGIGGLQPSVIEIAPWRLPHPQAHTREPHQIWRRAILDTA